MTIEAERLKAENYLGGLWRSFLPRLEVHLTQSKKTNANNNSKY